MDPVPQPQNPYPVLRNPRDRVIKIDSMGRMSFEYYEDEAYLAAMVVYQRRKKEESECRAHGARYYSPAVYPPRQARCTCWIQREYNQVVERRMAAYKKANAEAAKANPNHMQRCNTILN